MRTPVTLVTGAGGEIGHGLITRLAGTGRPIVTIDLAPLDPAPARLVHREFTGSITDANLLERVLAEFEVDLIFHLAALLSTRSEFTPITAHHVNVEGTLTLLEFAQREGESHGRDRCSSSIPRRSPPTACPIWRPRRAPGASARTSGTRRGRCTAATSCTASTSAATTRGSTSSWRRTPTGRVDFRCVRFPGPDLGGDGAVGRHVRLRARDDPRRGPRRAVRLLRPARHAHSVHGDARRRSTRCCAGRGAARAPDADGLQPDGVQPHARRRSTTWSSRRFPRASIALGAPTRSGRRSSTRGPRTWTTTAARRDWGFAPLYDFERAFDEYLIPTIRERYR